MTLDEKIVEAVALSIKRAQLGERAELSAEGPWRDFEVRAALAAITAYQAEAEKAQRDDAVEALASSWASIDGKLGFYDRERGLTLKQAMQANLPGHYAGYQAEAAEMIRRLRARGFDVVPVSQAPSTPTNGEAA